MSNLLGGLRGVVVPLALFVSLGVPVYFMVAALGTRFEWWHWSFGLGVLTIGIGPLLLMAAAALGVLAVLLAFLVSPRGLRLAAIVALAIPVAALVTANQMRAAATSVPPIHDISTDLEDPPFFSVKTMELRGPESNPILEPGDIIAETPVTASIAGKTRSEIQSAAYPDIEPIELSAGRTDALSASADVLVAMGLEIVAQDDVLGTIEATDTSFWFGFKDDVVVRVRASGTGGSLVDVRSVSRVGVSDLGANANRVRAFRTKLLRIIN